MMSDPTSVDNTTVDELTGKLVLLIEESRPWHDSGRMHQQLAAKVKHYVRYMRSQDFAREHGRKPKDTIVRLVSKQPPGDHSVEFFQHVSYELSKHRVAFEHQVGADGVPLTVHPLQRPAAPPPRQARSAVAPPREPAAEAEAPAETPTGAKPEAADAVVDEAPPEEAQPAAAHVSEEASTAAAPELVTEDERAAREEEPAVSESVVDEAAAAATAEISQVDEFDVTLDDFIIEPPDETEPAAETQKGATPTFTGHRATRGAAGSDNGLNDLMMEPSELERLVDGEQELEFIDFAQESRRSFEPKYTRRGGKEKYPPFFPEEEFGRALPEGEPTERFVRAAPEPAVIETSSGKRIVLDVRAADVAAAKRLPAEAQPSIARAIGGGAVAAMVGSAAWALLAVLAANGASLLALAVGAMVGISVRFQGNGRTMGFRLVGGLGGLVGAVFGTGLAATALTAAGVGFEVIGRDHPVGLAGVAELLMHPTSLAAAVSSYYGYLHVVVVGFAGYLGFRIAVPGPEK